MKKLELLLNPVGGGALGGGLGCQEDKRAGLLQLFWAQCRLALLCRQLNNKTSPQPSPTLGEGAQSLEKVRVINSCVSTVNSLPSCPLALRKCLAFTLAEILITLAIIGVVAAMTIPSLVAKYQQKTFATAFKKQYSVLNNTINFIVLDQGLSECHLAIENDAYVSKSSDCKALKQGLIDKLKLTQIEPYYNYTLTSVVLNNGGVSMNRTAEYNINKLTPYLLPDGAIICFTPPEMQGRSNYYIRFVLDTNGKKGPNRWGYDAFWLTLNKKNGKIRLTDEYASLSEKGGSLPRNILMNEWNNNYNKKVHYGVW